MVCVTQKFTVGGTVSNLQGTGLTLKDNGGNAYPVTGTGTVPFALPAIASGTTYAVTVSAQPVDPSQICTVTSGGSGTVGAGDVTSVQVGKCVTQRVLVKWIRFEIFRGPVSRSRTMGATRIPSPEPGPYRSPYPPSARPGPTYASDPGKCALARQPEPDLHRHERRIGHGRRG